MLKEDNKMGVENIRYKDFLDYAERLSFSEGEKSERGNYLLGLISEIDKARLNTERENEVLLQKDEIAFIMDKGFKTEPFWAFLKSGKVPEYGSPLTDYQDAYITYITSPLEKRVENFEELKNAEIGITALKGMPYLKYIGLTRGDHELSKAVVHKTLLGDIPYIKQVAYGKNGLKGQLSAVYEDMAQKHNPTLVEFLKELEGIVKNNDISTNNAQLYATAEFIQGKDGKEELLYTINAPLFKTNKMGEIRTNNNESLTFKVTDNGIEAAKYTDFNLYYDELEVEIPAPNGKTSIKTGKKAADYLKEHPNEDYPNPQQIQQVKIDNVLKWVYILPDMSYPEKGAVEPFTKDYTGIQKSIVSDRLKLVGSEIAKMSIEQEKTRSKEWHPTVSHTKNIEQKKWQSKETHRKNEGREISF
jgi:hypothetical protein